MFCANCGKELRDGVRFCGYCGSPVDPRNAKPSGSTGRSRNSVPVPGERAPLDGWDWDPEDIPSGRQPAGRNHSKKKSGKGLKILFIVLGILAVMLLVGLLLFFTVFRSGKPEDTIAKLEKAMNTADEQAILECFDLGVLSDYQNLLGSQDLGFANFLSSFGEMPEFDLEVIDVEKISSDQCSVTVQATITYSGTSETDTEKITMVKSGRKWLISMDELY
ncbi:MAG: zinc-ribbon domain-containing protein [Candidatus Choladocola sp.]|nr:zinc-ribbon domain-containing protein [Candidatus Choladocola sp.]